MIWTRQVKDRVANNYIQFGMLSGEDACQRLFASFCDDPLSHPLPELRLCCPELRVAAANNKCRLSFLFLALPLLKALILHLTLHLIDFKRSYFLACCSFQVRILQPPQSVPNHSQPNPETTDVGPFGKL
jgi:hypothetical protein